jgi:hypothetical protein
MFNQKRSKEMEIELFKDFIYTNEEVNDFLKIGLLCFEIFDFFESLYGKIINRGTIQVLLYEKLPEIYHIDPDFVACDMAGYRFGLRRKGHKKKAFELKRTYKGKLLYFTPPGTGIARVYYEITDAQIPSFPVRLLSTINELEKIQPATETQIRHYMMKNYERKSVDQQIKRWLPRLVRKGYIKEDNGTYYLPLGIKIIFHRDMQKTWEKLRVWPYRRIFYSR